MSAFLIGLERAAPLYSDAAGGIVLSPATSRLLCSYPRDGFTGGASCSSLGATESCVPGCTGGGRPWCTHAASETQGRTRSCGSHDPWRPEDLGGMLQDYQHRLRTGVTFTLGDQPHTQRQYNEVVLDATRWLDHLPHTVEAFFFPDSSSCNSPTSACQRFVREAHESFIKEYGRVAQETVPLLRLQFDRALPAFTIQP